MADLIALILKEAPSIITLIQARYAAANPDAPPLTAAQVVAGFEDAFTSTITKDDMIKAWINAQ